MVAAFLTARTLASDIDRSCNDRGFCRSSRTPASRAHLSTSAVRCPLIQQTSLRVNDETRSVKVVLKLDNLKARTTCQWPRPVGALSCANGYAVGAVHCGSELILCADGQVAANCALQIKGGLGHGGASGGFGEHATGQGDMSRKGNQAAGLCLSGCAAAKAGKAVRALSTAASLG